MTGVQTCALPILISLIPYESLARLKSVFGPIFVDFDQLEIQALVTADIEGYVDNIRMRQITGKHAADITKLFQNLVGKGALIQDGQGRWTRYSIPTGGHYLHKGCDSVHMERDSVHMERDSVHMERDSVHMERDSVHMERDSIHKIINHRSEERRVVKECRSRWSPYH